MKSKSTTPDELPEKPGVYLFKDVKDTILYVGKAKSLKKRVKSYFRDEIDDPKTRVLMRHFHHLEYMVTDTEKEALILESNLIKKLLPRYNIRLKDDKRYPYIQITGEKYPRLIITRNIKDDGSNYYGPFTDVTAVRSLLKLLKPVFQLRDCKRMDGPCLNYQIQLCPAPCDKRISKEEYQAGVEKAKMFLEGRKSEVIELLEKEMGKAALDHNYEKAAAIRDQLFSLKDVLEKQKMEFERNLEQDVIAYSAEDNVVVVVVFRVREGKILGKEDYIMEGVTEEIDKPSEVNNDSREIFSAFIKQYYSGPRQIPREIILPDDFKEELIDHELITGWLYEKREGNVTIRVPQKGLEERLSRMVRKNADIILKHHKKSVEALFDLKEYLKMSSIPRRIEAFDISNISGQMAVASMVVFEDGEPKKNHYRRYKLKTPGPDDYAMMEEVLTRRYNKLVSEGENPPDLMVVDGGKGQLNVAVKVLNSFNIDTNVIGLAKEFEQIFIPSISIPIILPSSSPALHLLQRVRDEAHRFALKYHKKLRKKDIESSILDEIPGIGPKRKIALLRHFGDLNSVKNATIDEIEAVNGINRNLALKIYEYLQKKGD